MSDSVKPGKFVCPPNYILEQGSSLLNYEDVESDDVELWLIQAPKGLDISKLENKEILIDGVTNIEIGNSNGQALQCAVTELEKHDKFGYNVVLPKKSDSNLCFVPKPFARHLLITESLNVPEIFKDLPSVIINEKSDQRKKVKREIPNADIVQEMHCEEKDDEFFINASSSGLANEKKKKKKHKKNKHKDQDLGDIGSTAAYHTLSGKVETDSLTTAMSENLNLIEKPKKKKKKHRHSSE